MIIASSIVVYSLLLLNLLIDYHRLLLYFFYIQIILFAQIAYAIRRNLLIMQLRLIL